MLLTITARAILALAVLALAGMPAGAADPPRRVASFNVCADQLVIALADPDQIVGLSPYASDPAISVVAEKARRVSAARLDRRNRWSRSSPTSCWSVPGTAR